MNLKKHLIGIAAIAFLATTTSSANAAAGVKVGRLVCDVDGGFGLVVTSKKTMNCIYSASGGEKESYSGSIRKFGLDVGVTSKATMVWVVIAHGKVGPKALRGKYVGGVAQASAGVGAGSHVLVGGHDKGISLQPVSVQAHRGLNIAAGVGSLVLQ